jgi:hypothetical protein
MDLIALAEESIGEPLRGEGTLGLEQGQDAPTVLTNVLTATVGLLTIIAAIWFVFLLITGAIGIITSGGDKAALENAQKRITNGLIGLVIVVAAIFIIDLIGNILGIPNILNPAAVISNLNL